MNNRIVKSVFEQTFTADLLGYNEIYLLCFTKYAAVAGQGLKRIIQMDCPIYYNYRAGNRQGKPLLP